MTSMMMLDITIEVSISKELPSKGRTQAWLGHFWAHLSTFTFRLILAFRKLYSFGLRTKFTGKIEINNKLDKYLI